MADPTLELATSIAKPLATKLIEALLKPIVSTSQTVADPFVDLFTNRFSEYLTRQYVKHSYLPTIVFQVRRPLEELYIPLTLKTESSLYKVESAQSFKIDRYHVGLLPKLERVLVIDSAGMGKSTLSRFLMIQAIKTNITVPIFIELRHLNANRSILDVLISELNPVGSEANELKIEKRHIIRLLNKGIFTFILDGYDEIANKEREKVTIDIKRLTETYSNNKFLVTSRPEHSLTAFPSFKVFAIQPLKNEEAFTLIKKYDCDGEKSKRLIERLEDKSLPDVNEFLKNPLLTTLLYRAFDYKNQIPLKKPVFYRQVYDALYEWHDLTKDGYSTRDKASGLDIDSFHKILRGLGFISILNGIVETDTDTILQWIRNAKKYAPELTFSESDFLEDAIKAVPVLRREGNAILWSHKSLAEYFAAQFIITDAKKDQEKICEHFANVFELPSLQNFLGLIYDIDQTVFNQNFTRPFLALYKSHREKLISNYPSIPKELVEQRASVTFGRKFLTVPTANETSSKGLIAKVTILAREATAEWFPNKQIVPSQFTGVALGFRVYFSAPITKRSATSPSSRHQVLILTHPLITVLDVLREKKAPVILQRAFYPTKVQKSVILGLRAKANSSIDDNVLAIWNREKNFESTTSGLLNIQAATIIPERVDAILREINQSDGESQITANLIASVAKQ